MSAPLLLLPGIGSDEAVWKGMPQGLVMCSDADTIDAMAEDILARAPPTFALAGHSMGGYIALAMAVRAPERLVRLALLSTAAAPDDAAQAAARATTIKAAQSDFEAVARRLSRAMLHPDRGESALADEMEAMIRRVGRAAFLRQQRATKYRPDRRADLSAIAAPCLILTGADDRIVSPDRSTELAAGLRRAELRILNRCGHIPQREAPVATATALSAWLQTTA